MVEPGLSPTLARLHEVISRINADPDVDAVLQAIADGVVEVSGFRAASINVLYPREDTFELVAVSGDDPGLQDLLHHRYPSRTLLERNAVGEAWGRFRFVSHERALATPEGYVVLEQEPAEGPDAWHPLDELSVTLHSPRGDLLGIMYIDQPTDGRLPSRDVLAVLEIYAVAAGVAINHAQRAARDHEAVWLAGLVRAVIETLSGPDELDVRMRRVMGQLRSELQAEAAWLDAFPDDASGAVAPSEGDRAFTVAAAVDSYGTSLAEHALERGEALTLDRGLLEQDHDWLTEQQRGWLRRSLQTDEITSIALVPLDNDEDLAGQLLLARRSDRRWSDQVLETLRDVGRELGWALGRERSREQARSATEEVARADRERREVLTSLSAEVRPAYTALDTRLRDLPADDPARQALEQLWTTYNRVSQLVAFEGPGHTPRAAPVDVTAVVAAHLSHLVELGRSRSVNVLPLESTGQLGWADPEEIEWVVLLLTEDVVLRCDPGSSVRFGVVTLNHRIVLSCLVAGAEDPDEQVGSPAGSGPPAMPWWHVGAQQVLARSDARISTREGPLGRRVVSLSLPVPPTL